MTAFTYWCTACTATFTTARAAQRHAKGRGHVVLIDDVLEPSTTTTNAPTRRTP